MLVSVTHIFCIFIENLVILSVMLVQSLMLLPAYYLKMPAKLLQAYSVIEVSVKMPSLPFRFAALIFCTLAEE